MSGEGMVFIGRLRTGEDVWASIESVVDIGPELIAKLLSHQVVPIGAKKLEWEVVIEPMDQITKVNAGYYSIKFCLIKESKGFFLKLAVWSSKS